MAKEPIPKNITKSQDSKTCTKCGIAKPFTEFHKSKDGRYGLQSYCKNCKSEYGQNNRDEIIARLRRYYQDTKEVAAVKNKQYREKNKEAIKAKKKAYYEANKYEINANKRERYKTDNSQSLKQNKIYRQTEKGRSAKRAARHKRRAIKRGCISEDFTREEIFVRDNYRCQLCGRKTRPDYKNSYHPLYPNLDHIVPLSCGGGNTKENTQCLCHQCNMKKGNVGTGDQLRLFGG
jgi:5-methylcytosine-specific restriction endonuclease McrA